MSLLLASLASAHVPHDAIVAVAPPADLSPANVWYMTMSPHGTALYYRSDTGGASWDLAGGAHTGTELLDLARLSDDSVVALTGPTVWSSADGVTWTQTALPEPSAQVVSLDDTVALAGPTCLWTGPALGPFVCAVAGAATLLGPDAAVVDGSVVIFDGTTWVAAGAPEADVTAVLAVDGVAYAGTSAGELFRFDGAWSPCGPLPPTDESPLDVVQLAWTGSALLVATATAGPYLSEDACGTFADRGTGMPVLYGQDGGPSSPTEATVFLAGAGDTWVTAGWAGLYLSHDAGASWEETPTFSADYLRGLAFAPGFPEEDPHLYTGGYGAAIERTVDGGASWDAPAHGITSANAQRIEVSALEPGRVYAVVGHDFFRSHDHGSEWRRFAEEIAFAGGLVTFPDPGRIWVWGGGVVLETVDDGDTWAELTAVEATIGAGLIDATWYADTATPYGRVCATATNPIGLACGELGGDTWEAWYAPAGGAATAPVAWPNPSATERILLAVDGHAVAFDMSGALVADVALDAEDLPHRLAITETGAVFLATRAGRIWRSLDGGDTYTTLDLRLTGAPSSVAPRPDFTDHPDVLFGTHDGLWLLADAEGAAPTLTRFQGHQRIDDASDFFVCSECPNAITDPAASMDSFQHLPFGATAEVWVKGTRVAVHGEGGDVPGTVWIDGEAWSVAVDAPRGVVLNVDGLADTWHRVELAGAGTPGWRVDAVEAWRNTMVLDVPIPEDTGGETGIDTGDTDRDPPKRPRDPTDPCGCAAGPTGGAGMVALALVVGVRRRRAGRSALAR